MKQPAFLHKNFPLTLCWHTSAEMKIDKATYFTYIRRSFKGYEREELLEKTQRQYMWIVWGNGRIKGINSPATGNMDDAILVCPKYGTDR